MREVRPTIKVLKDLPRETYGDTEPLDLIHGGDWKRLRLYGVDHPLLLDARKRFATGLPDRHKEASRKAGRPVFEVRDRDGAGWRGAVVLDEGNDPWLVYVEKHDRFHHRVAGVAWDERMPTAVEYKLRAREEAAIAETEWKMSLLRAFADGLCEATRRGVAVPVLVPGLARGESAEILVEVEHDEPAAAASDAHLGVSLMTARLRLVAEGRAEFEQAILQVCLPFIQPDPTRMEPVYGKAGDLIVYVEVSHTKMIQLMSGVVEEHQLAGAVPQEPTRLHYVGINFLVDGYVNGHPVRGVCGTWFVPTRDDSADLPICGRCEEEHPAAEAVLDLLRGR